MAWLPFIFILYFLCLLAERALVGLSSHDLDVMKTENSRASRHTAAFTEDIRTTLAALLLTRILMIIVAGVNAAAWMLHAEFARQWVDQINGESGWLLAGALLTLGLSLVFWGLQKIDIQKNKSDKAVSILKRLWWLVFFWKKVRFFVRKEGVNSRRTKEEQMNAPTESAASEKRELELLKSIVQFGDVTVKQVMQPRSKVVAIDFKAKFPELLEIVRQSEFSRLPVFDDDLDNVVGILYVKDLITHLNESPDFEWQSLIRTNVLMVPEAKRGIELLEEFKRERMHMAIVVDEYGGSAGIVTLEDVLEEVTGDIRDEFDEDSDIRYRKLDDFTYIFEGQILLNDVCHLTGLSSNAFDSVRGNADTLAGLVLELRGDIPVPGEEIHWGGYVLTVNIADRRRIEQIKLSLPRS